MASDKAHWVEVGRCYERFALQATALGIRNAFMNQLVEVGSIRPQFGAMPGLGNERPDFVVRFGLGPKRPGRAAAPWCCLADRCHQAGNNRLERCCLGNRIGDPADLVAFRRRHRGGRRPRRGGQPIDRHALRADRVPAGRRRPPVAGGSRQRWRARPGHGNCRRAGAARHSRERDVALRLPAHADACRSVAGRAGRRARLPARCARHPPPGGARRIGGSSLGDAAGDSPP